MLGNRLYSSTSIRPSRYRISEMAVLSCRRSITSATPTRASIPSFGEVRREVVQAVLASCDHPDPVTLSPESASQPPPGSPVPYPRPEVPSQSHFPLSLGCLQLPVAAGPVVYRFPSPDHVLGSAVPRRILRVDDPGCRDNMMFQVRADRPTHLQVAHPLFLFDGHLGMSGRRTW